ncbi:MAG: hypothetical protein IJT66_02200 [Clostridia bacterium]|nr:hypothetical protein [Clostridia bacterium]
MAKTENKKHDEPSLREQKPFPEDAFDTVNNYGTYNIQPTADTDHMYPAIAQGFHKALVQTDAQNREAEDNNKT